MSKLLLLGTALIVLISSSHGWSYRRRTIDVDCVVSEKFGNWTECEPVEDEMGNIYMVKYRSKLVLVEPRGKGEPCPPREEAICNEEEQLEKEEEQIENKVQANFDEFGLAPVKKSYFSSIYNKFKGRRRSRGSDGSSSDGSSGSSGSSSNGSGSSSDGSSSDSDSSSDSSRSRSRSSSRSRSRSRSGRRSRSRSRSRSGRRSRSRSRSGRSRSRSRSGSARRNRGGGSGKTHYYSYFRH